MFTSLSYSISCQDSETPAPVISLSSHWAVDRTDILRCMSYVSLISHLVALPGNPLAHPSPLCLSFKYPCSVMDYEAKKSPPYLTCAYKVFVLKCLSLLTITESLTFECHLLHSCGFPYVPSSWSSSWIIVSWWIWCDPFSDMSM